jgi:RHS repeat-associated protein
MIDPGSCSSAQRPAFFHDSPGKERDGEVGLDYFGARYYSAALGRFTSADPILLMIQRIADPQQLNAYAYMRNNPLAFIDSDGMWLAPVHDEMYLAALPGLTTEQMEALKSESFWMDIFDQTKSNSPEHYMAAPGRSPSQAKNDAEKYISAYKYAAKSALGKGCNHIGDINIKSIKLFAFAAHAIIYGLDPLHVDSDGNPLAWTYGLFASNAIKHAKDEKKLLKSNEYLNYNEHMVDLIRTAFLDVYGPEIAAEAFKERSNPRSGPVDSHHWLPWIERQ